MIQRTISTTPIFPKATLYVATSCIGSGLRDITRFKESLNGLLNAIERNRKS